MEVLIIRHALAGTRDSEKWPDDRDRPITAAGARKFREVALALSVLVPKIDGIWSSPYRRAWQTAEILEAETGWPAPEALDSLAPDMRSEQLVTFLQKRDAKKRIAFVGHEPSLSAITSHLLTRDTQRVGLEIKKGGALLLRFDGKITAGSATLIWMLPPRVVLAFTEETTR